MDQCPEEPTSTRMNQEVERLNRVGMQGQTNQKENKKLSFRKDIHLYGPFPQAPAVSFSVCIVHSLHLNTQRIERVYLDLADGCVGMCRRACVHADVCVCVCVTDNPRVQIQLY